MSFSPVIETVTHSLPLSRRKKEELFSRLHRIEGQIRGIKSMIENEMPCNDVLHQVSSTKSAVVSAKVFYLEEYIKGCLAARLQQGSNDAIDELYGIVARLDK